jgi:hypothetical protein
MAAVIGVWLTVIEQLLVLSVAAMAMLIRLVPDAVAITNTAVCACSTGTTNHHDVPSRPTRQFSAAVWLCVMGHDRFVTACVAVGA